MFRLARDLNMTVRQLRSSLTASDFTDWLAFYSFEAKTESDARREANR
jgi:hypothetical protein